jgi:hypothetical protein
MNERIDELMIEAGARFEFLHGVHYDDFQYEKFAELIVRECAEVALKTDISYIEIDAMHRIRDRIKDHFGVI